MSRCIRSFLGVALLVAAPLAGQTTRSADATATVVIASNLSVVKTTDLDFGTHFSSDGMVSNSVPARWDGSTDVGNHISVAFTTLPSQLTRVGGGDAVAITYGVESAQFSSALSSASFNPSTGIPDAGAIPAPGSFHIQLGLGSAVSQRAAVD